MTYRPQEGDRPSAGALLSDILAGLSRLMRGEIALARAEVEQTLRGAAQGVLLLLVAVVLGTVGLHALAGAAIAELVTVGLSPAGAALAVGGLLLIVAVICATRGAALLSHASHAPHRALRSLARDVETLKTAVNPDAAS